MKMTIKTCDGGPDIDRLMALKDQLFDVRVGVPHLDELDDNDDWDWAPPHNKPSLLLLLKTTP